MSKKDLLQKLTSWDLVLQIVFIVVLFGAAVIVVAIQDCSGAESAAAPVNE